MARSLKILMTREVMEFINNLDTASQKAIIKSVDKVKTGIVRKTFFSKLHGTEDLWEFRAASSGLFIRLLAFYDKYEKGLIIVISGFCKKTNKTPKSEIKRAEARKKRYFFTKQ